MANNNIRIFRIKNSRARILKSEGAAKVEKDLQKFVEGNLDELLGVTYLGSEVEIGGGRMDTVGVDDSNRPVIIEYKKGQQEGQVLQVLAYRGVLGKQKAVFKVLALENKPEIANKVRWPARAICIARDFGSREKATVQGEDTELIQYEYLEDNLFALKWVTGNPPKQMVKKSTKNRSERKGTARETVLAEAERLREEVDKFAQNLSEVEKRENVRYNAYKLGHRTFASLIPEIQGYVLMFLSLHPDKIRSEECTRDVRDIKHPGVGDLEVSIYNRTTLRKAKILIKRSHREMLRELRR